MMPIDSIYYHDLVNQKTSAQKGCASELSLVFFSHLNHSLIMSNVSLMLAVSIMLTGSGNSHGLLIWPVADYTICSDTLLKTSQSYVGPYEFCFIPFFPF